MHMFPRGLGGGEGRGEEIKARDAGFPISGVTSDGLVVRPHLALRKDCDLRAAFDGGCLKRGAR